MISRVIVETDIKKETTGLTIDREREKAAKNLATLVCMIEIVF